MFNFLNFLYKNNIITLDKLKSYCPKWISEEELNKIII